MRRCERCTIIKAFDAFARCPGGRLRRICKMCNATAQNVTRRILARTDKAKATAKRWRQTEKGKAYIKRRRERQRATAQWKEYMREYERQRRITKRDYLLAHCRQYKQSEKGRIAMANYNHRRRALTRSGHISLSDWHNIVAGQGGRCFYCLAVFTATTKPTQDHVIPLSRGGVHEASNIVAACLLCNRKKGISGEWLFTQDKLA